MPFFAHDGAELFYTDGGSGPPILFLHGLGGSTENWDAQVEHFERRRYRVIALDMRGSGQSRDTRHPDGPFTALQFAADTRALIANLALDRVHVVGLSMGGAVAFQLAVDAPELLQTMTICNSAPAFIVRGVGPYFAILLRRVITMIQGPAGMARMLAPRLFPGEQHAALRERFIANMARNRPGAYAASQRALFGWSVADKLAQIRVPTLVIGAEHDYPFLLDKAAWVRQMPQAELVVVPNTHHALPVEAPEAFNQVLEAFLERHAV